MQKLSSHANAKAAAVEWKHKCQQMETLYVKGNVTVKSFPHSVFPRAWAMSDAVTRMKTCVNAFKTIIYITTNFIPS
jgi:hypothetical protein